MTEKIGGGLLRICGLTIGALLALAAAGASARAQEKAPVSPANPQSAAAAAVQIPDAYKLNMLIRTTLIALSQANQTGNYSVLRDLGTPAFQAMNTDAALATAFANLRVRNLDFSPIVFFDPKLVRNPEVNAKGMLRLTGYIPTSPERILFDLGFEEVDGQWRLVAIVVDMQAAPPPAAAASPPPKAPKAPVAKSNAKQP